jgi:Ca2+-binding RTX toxin-like protein
MCAGVYPEQVTLAPDDIAGIRSGADALRGGSGGDRINGGPGIDTCLGGPGADQRLGCEFGG